MSAPGLFWSFWALRWASATSILRWRFRAWSRRDHLEDLNKMWVSMRGSLLMKKHFILYIYIYIEFEQWSLPNCYRYRFLCMAFEDCYRFRELLKLRTFAAQALGFRSKFRELLFSVFTACSLLWFLPLQGVINIWMDPSTGEFNFRLRNKWFHIKRFENRSIFRDRPVPCLQLSTVAPKSEFHIWNTAEVQVPCSQSLGFQGVWPRAATSVALLCTRADTIKH